MNFKLTRPVIDQRLCKIVSKEVRKQALKLFRANTNHLQEMAAISRDISKWGLSKNLIRRKLPHGLGYGIFLHPKAQPILKGQMIASYSGETYLVPQNMVDDSLYAFEVLSDILLNKEEQAYFDSDRKYHPKRLYALYINALKKGNFTRFINHSDKPNIEAELFKIPRNAYGLAPSPIEVVYLAKRIIRPGEQLLVNYDGDGLSYWGAVDFKPIPITPKTFQLNLSLKVIGALKE